MSNRLSLAFTVNVAGTSYGQLQASMALAAVPLYANPTNDPVLGQFFGFTVANDSTSAPAAVVSSASNASPIVLGVPSTTGFQNGDTVTVAGVTGNTAANGIFRIAGLTPTGFQLVGSTGNGAYTGGGTMTDDSSATRTIVLNMTYVHAPTAPPPFPCNPITATPPVPPFPLLTTKDVPGTLLTTPGSNVVGTSVNETPSIVPGNTIQFISQPGVYYTVATVVAPPLTGITLTAPYTGPFTEDGDAVLMVAAPAAIVAVYSTSQQDSIGVATVPPLPAGNGAQSVEVSYLDSTGTPFTVSANLMGTFPVQVTLAAGSKDVAVITAMQVLTTGPFGNSVGQITLCQLSAPAPYVSPDATPQKFQMLTDQAQGLITRGLVYLPPSFFALAQQGLATPMLAGEFQLPGRFMSRPAGNAVTPGGVSVATTVSQVGILAAGNVIEFVTQPGVFYTLASVGNGIIGLTTAYTGLNDNAILASARLITPSPAMPPTSAELAGNLAEFVNPGTAVPPPSLPLAPQTMTPSPIFLSGMFARTLQLALAVPVVPSAIVLS